MPIGLTGFRNRKMLTTTATAPLAFPSTCNVKGLVHFVTRKFVRFTENANKQFNARMKKKLRRLRAVLRERVKRVGFHYLRRGEQHEKRDG